MEFVRFTDAWRALEDGGVLPADDAVPLPPPGPAMLASLSLALEQSDACFRLAPGAVDGAAGERGISIDRDRLGESIDHLLHKLHLSPVVALPRTRWRVILDAVAFTLAEHRGWQEIEAEATLVLNTRDALLCGPADLKMLRTLVDALLQDGGGADEALLIVPASGRLLVEVLPGAAPAVRIEVSTAALAKSVHDLLSPGT